MLTGAERNSLVLTLAFVLLGSGVKLWRKAETEIGPFPTDPPAAESLQAAAESTAETAESPEVAESTEGTAESPETIAESPVAAAGAAPAFARPLAGALPDARAEVSAGVSGIHVASVAASTPDAPDAAGRNRKGGSDRGAAAKRKAPPAGRVDVNRASAEALTAVPGIGPKLAEAIIAHRRERGAFRDLAQLREVKGIGEKKWAVIAPCLTVAAGRAAPPGDTAGKGTETDGAGGIGGR